MLKERTFKYTNASGRGVEVTVDSLNRVIDLELQGEVNVCDLEKYIRDLREKQLGLNSEPQRL